jgi:hypothetical protein
MMAEGLDQFPFDWIAADLSEGNCIPFLGAGASAFPKEINAKPPSARLLAWELAKESRYPAYQIASDPAGPDSAGRRPADYVKNGTGDAAQSAKIAELLK